MSLFGFALLADENIHPEVVRALAERETNVVSVAQIDLAGADDRSILARARAEERVVLTHDRDFGTLAIRAGEPFFGIVTCAPAIYLRPACSPCSMRSTLQRLS